MISRKLYLLTIIVFICTIFIGLTQPAPLNKREATDDNSKTAVGSNGIPQALPGNKMAKHQ
ncbi:hypothetical protein RhiirC2_756892 [Rhizophagus irregularis]|uniref:Uncharacterized protein n=1 Tax=Rhizophagus irregularis TaxID=588596 RepID=A0A2N1MRP9_9GLOM|nr:hypothetical protein RhiirC2_756892 [Rhizophagus irregularis]